MLHLTHWEDCWRVHHACAEAKIVQLQEELKKLQEELKRTEMSKATLADMLYDITKERKWIDGSH